MMIHRSTFALQAGAGGAVKEWNLFRNDAEMFKLYDLFIKVNAVAHFHILFGRGGHSMRENLSKQRDL